MLLHKKMNVIPSCEELAIGSSIIHCDRVLDQAIDLNEIMLVVLHLGTYFVN